MSNGYCVTMSLVCHLGLVTLGSLDWTELCVIVLQLLRRAYCLSVHLYRRCVVYSLYCTVITGQIRAIIWLVHVRCP